MSFSMQKFTAIFQMKLSTILKNRNIMIVPLMALGFVILMGALMPHQDTHEIGMTKEGFILGFGLSFNIIMGGIMMSSYPLAEEKEKKTLRVLMTSSVTNLEFFFASLLPPLLVMTVVNILLIPAANLSFSDIPLITYFLMTTICGAISLIIGLIIGLTAKDQMQAGLIGMPVMLVLTLLPNFAALNQEIGKISIFTYPGVLNKFVQSALMGVDYSWNFKDSLVLLVWLIISSLIFMSAYKKNGLDD